MNSFYAASSENFFQDVKQGRFQQLMIENASRQNINVGEAEQRSYKASGQKIKELLKAGRIKDVYLVFELMVPYSGCRIDCMIFGCDSEDGKNVMHIELKQWSEDGIFPASTSRFSTPNLPTREHRYIHNRNHEPHKDTRLPITDHPASHLPFPKYN